MEQKTNEWFEFRKGRFTGSEIHKLLGKKGLGETGNTYAFEKAVEIAFGYDQEDSFVSFDMQRGIELEPLAFRRFAESKEADFINVENASFFPYGENGGASPDGLVGKDAVLEIKCPKPNKFFRIMAGGLGEIDTQYYAQMQMEMLCTNSERCHFFNYIIYNGVEMWHEIVVNRDNLAIELIKERIIEAVIVRDQFVEKLKLNKQF